MKKIFAVLMAAVLALGCFMTLCACDVSTTPPAAGNDSADIVVPEGTKNAIVINYTKNGNGTVTARISIDGDVAFAGVSGVLNYDSAVLTYASSTASLNGLVLNTDETGKVSFSYANTADITQKTDLFTVTFNYTAPVNTNLSISIDAGNFSNAALEDVQYSVLGGNIKID